MSLDVELPQVEDNSEFTPRLRGHIRRVRMGGMRLMLFPAVLLLSTSTALVGCSSTTTDPSSSPSISASASEVALPADVQSQLQTVLDSAREEFGFPGVQAGVWIDDGAWIGVSGKAGPDEQRPPQRDDHTRIGSITKTFTVTALLQLVEQGKVSLDDTIDKYVSDMQNGSTATLADLAQMTSGIPNYTESTDFTDKYFADTSAVWQPQKLVDVVKGDKPMFKAGDEMYYSNTNLVLLGMVIEQVTGQSMSEMLTEGIFKPLGLEQTTFPGTSAEIASPHLSGITEQGDPEGEVKNATDWNPSWGFTAGEMISTLDDLRAWGVALGTGEGVLDSETQQLRIKSLTTDVPPNTAERSYGLGFGRDNGWIGHTGELPGFNSAVWYHPDSNSTVVVMVNSDIPKNKKNPAPEISTALQSVLG